MSVLPFKSNLFAHGVNRFRLRLVIRAHHHFRQQAHQEKLHPENQRHQRHYGQRRLNEISMVRPTGEFHQESQNGGKQRDSKSK